MFLKQIYDSGLAQAAYLVGCQATGEAIVIDPERDIERYHRIAEENGLRIGAVAETHIHADFVSGAQEFAADPGITLYLSGLGGPDWSYNWVGDRPNTVFLSDHQIFNVGNIRFEAVHSPGHTPEHMSYLVTDVGGGADTPIAIATGDLLFVGDVGRPDLLESAAGVVGAREPAARELASSLQGSIAPLNEFVQVLPGHGAGSACGKALGAVPSSTVGYERRFNAPFVLANKDPVRFVTEVLSGQPEPPRYFGRMKQVNRDGIAVTGGVPDVEHLAPEEFLKCMETGQARVIDARRDRAAFLAERLPKAVNAPFTGTEFTAAAGSVVEPEESILLVLDSSRDADEASRLLYRIGYDHVKGWITHDELAAARSDTFVSLPSRPFQDFGLDDLSENDQLLDVRRSDEFESAHVEGAVLIPHTRLSERLVELNRNKRYLVYCRTGRRATVAASFLAAEGFDVVLLDGDCARCMTAAA